MLHKLIEQLYRLVGRLLMSRVHYLSTCAACGAKSETYYPDNGAFLWEIEYWRVFRPSTCCLCSHEMVAKRSKVDGILGALYRLPGYAAHDRETFRRLMTAARVAGRI